jgi:hypothetical protein
MNAVLAGRREEPEAARAIHRVLTEEATPPRLRRLAAGQGKAFRAALKGLIVQAQRSGEISVGDPEQLTTVVMACLDGLSQLAGRDPQMFDRHVRDASLLMRLLRG